MRVEFSCMNPASSRPFPQVIGVLKGYDQLLNLVLDDVEEEVSGKHPQ